MTAEDIKKVTFEKSMRGYRSEDVDDFLAKTATAIDEITIERDDAIAAQKDIENKMYILAQKVEEYRGLEDTLKTALINAQRMGETVVHEAKQKADSLLRDASGKAELLRQQAEQEIMSEQRTLERLQAEVTRFKAMVLNLYKQHIESLSALDTPVVRVDEFLKEFGFEKPIKPLTQAEYGTEDGKEAALSERVYAQEEAQGPATQTEIISGGLFEGIPIERE